MSNSAPSLVGVADAILEELRQVQLWITDVRAELVDAERKRVKLACALESAASALEPQDREEYEEKIETVLGYLGRVQPGRPHVDERYDTVIRLLAEWTDELISTAEIRIEFERRRLASSRSYISNLLKRLGNRGLVLREGYGRYRIVRHHPALVWRRAGFYDGRRPPRQAGPGIRRL